MGHHYDVEDVHQVFDISMWESKQKGFSKYQSMTKAKFMVWDFERAQLKQHFRKECTGCGKRHSFTVTACDKCHTTIFNKIPIREYPEIEFYDKKLTTMDQRSPDPADIALAPIELQQFREYIIPYCNSVYDLYIFDAMIDGLRVFTIAKLCNKHFECIDKRYLRLKRLYKSFTRGTYENPPTKYSKKTAVYKKGKDPTLVSRRVLDSPRSTFKSLSAHLPPVILTPRKG